MYLVFYQPIYQQVILIQYKMHVEYHVELSRNNSCAFVTKECNCSYFIVGRRTYLLTITVLFLALGKRVFS